MAARIGLAFIVVVALAAVGLAVYASRLVPPHHVYQQVIPSDHFAG
jgi:hypothetical protein